ncbi:MAG: hypothetical protein V9E98_04155 [Candidatus Nanopelagicales bacterium]|jgi:hypothetical protein
MNHLATLALLANESELVESESVVPLPSWVYGAIALVTLLLLLVVVTRLNLDR